MRWCGCSTFNNKNGGLFARRFVWMDARIKSGHDDLN
jgi:hypothetical protein